MAQIWEVTNEQYHADKTRVGSTMMKVALESLSSYYGHYIGTNGTGGWLMVDKATPAQIRGSAMHARVLEPENFDKLFACRPEGLNGTRKEDKPKIAAFELASMGKTLLTTEINEQSKATASAVLAEPLVRELMEGAIRERAIIWTDEESGLECKCKPDLFIARPDMASDLHVDIKSSDDPYPENWKSTSPFSPIFKYRYDLQVAAHYPAGIEALTGRPCASGLIVVGISPPHDVFYYDTTAHRDCGEAWRRRALQEIARCHRINIWRRPEQDFVIQLPAPPAWAFPQE